MREIRPSGSEGGVALTTPSLPLSFLRTRGREACLDNEPFAGAMLASALCAVAGQNIRATEPNHS
jgi:hypothetical protein